ncbi:MAG: hypothetical protein R3191_07030 [Anaerolineales bacterium]|nr:hypothetical protein [Anaerolineales bacterium]
MTENNGSRVQDKLRLAGEVVSHLLNVPILSGAMVTFIFFRLPTDVPNRASGFGLTLAFLCLIPLASLLFYIPGGVRDWARIVRRQRIASFVLMIVSYPIGYVLLRVTEAPTIYEAIAVTYTLVTLGLIVFNLILRYKASGHAAGVAGPVAALIYLYGLVAAPLLALIPLVTWARVQSKAHDLWQNLVGAGLSLSITVLVLWLYGFPPLMGVVP